MAVVVTGASGHIGANLVRALLAEGRPPRCLVHDDARALEGLDLERVRGDLRDPASLAPLVDGAEVVFHLAAKISIRNDDEAAVRAVNVGGTNNLLAACLERGVKRLVHFSSIHALSPHPVDQWIDETRPLTSGRVPAYDHSKADGERAVLAAVERGLDVVIVNPTAVLGPFDFGPSLMGQALHGMRDRTLPALVAGGFDWVDVRDVVAGALAAERRGRTGERYLLGGRYLPLPALAKLVEEVTGRRVPRLVSPMWMARLGVPFVSAFARLTGREPLYTGPSLHALRNHGLVRHDKASGELGFTARPLRDTIADTFAWFDERSRAAERGPRPVAKESAAR